MIPTALRIIRRIPPLERFFYQMQKPRSQFLWEKICDFLPNSPAKIIDIGAGDCLICELIKNQKGDIVAIDVVDKSLSKIIIPKLFDGKKIPFKNRLFDTSLIITVLHHTSNPEGMILEAKRVSKRIIIIEDIFNNLLEKYLTYIVDSIHNLEFVDHPHANKTDAGWKTVFAGLNLRLLETKYFSSFPFYRHALYYLSVE